MMVPSMLNASTWPPRNRPRRSDDTYTGTLDDCCHKGHDRTAGVVLVYLNRTSSSAYTNECVREISPKPEKKVWGAPLKKQRQDLTAYRYAWPVPTPPLRLPQLRKQRRDYERVHG